jgi:hypothetical protein
MNWLVGEPNGGTRESVAHQAAVVRDMFQWYTSG